jgi:lipopolysaccharide biosynthesis glycosyltransferase
MMMKDQDEKRWHWKIRLRFAKLIVLLIASLHFGGHLVLLSSFVVRPRPPHDPSSPSHPASPQTWSQPMSSSSSSLQALVQRHDQHHQEASAASVTLPLSSPAPLYSYASIIGGCNPDKPAYRGYLYTVLMSWQTLREQAGSNSAKADFCLFIQMSNQYTTANVLPKKEHDILQQVGIHVYYMPKVEKESFYSSMMDKFRILNLTQYRRVLFLDADLLALGNLYYLFEMSDNYNNNAVANETSPARRAVQPPPLLQPNLVLAGALEPASGGFFMLEPAMGKLERLQGILAERNARNKTGRYFNATEGWGHVIDPKTDPWKSTKNQNGKDWGFPGSHADQGLLYHWVMYVESNVSLVIGDLVENWSNGQLQSTLENPFQQYQPTVVFYNECLRWKQRHCVNPYKSIVHYTGRSKPWLADTPPANIGINNTAIKKTYWWYRLSLLNDELDLGLDFDHWTKIDNPTLGFVPAVQN